MQFKVDSPQLKGEVKAEGEKVKAESEKTYKS